MKLNSTRVVLALMILCAQTLYGQDGSTDNSFGINGKRWDPPTTYPVSALQESTVPRILVQPDGKILHIAPTNGVGIVITRYTADGAVDASFGAGGTVTTGEANSVYAPRNAYMLPDGRFLVIGESRVNPVGAEHGFAVIKFNADGTFDNSFSGDGKAVIALASSNPVARGIAVQTDGKIVVVGTSPGQFTTVRFNTDGSADSSFDGDGVVKSTLSDGGSESAYAVTIAPDGKILVAGQVTNPASVGPYTYFRKDMGVIRYNADGSIDTSFGTAGDGTRVTAYSEDWATGIAIQPSDGKIVLTGHWGTYDDPDNSGYFAMRLLPNGTNDATYGNNGLVDFYVSGRARSVDMVMQADEKVIIGGYSLCSGGCSYQGWVDIQLKRITTSGTVDGSFGPGKVEYEPVTQGPSTNGSVDVGGSIAGQGVKLITGGFSKSAGQTKNFLTRLNNSVALLPRNPVATTPPANYTMIPAKIEAENYSSQSGTQTEGTADAGGGQNVGYIDGGDYLDYNISVPATGTYTVKFRVASQMSGGQFAVYNQAGTQIQIVDVPNTGGWQNWVTVTDTVNLNAGDQIIRIQSSSASNWNINWLEFTQGTTPPPPPPGYVSVPAKIEAEAYTSQVGTQTESTSDAGGGQNVGWIDNGDWLDYNINAAAGNYTFTARVASQMTGGQFQVRSENGTVLATVNVPNTNGWQTWVNVDVPITLPAGNQKIRLISTSGASWNINWFEIKTGSPPPPPPPTNSISGRIQAENYNSQTGTQTEPTTDTGGGLNVGWIDAGDRMQYTVNASTAGTYRLSYRVASAMTGGKFELRTEFGTLIDNVTVPNTGGWQNWVTVQGGTYNFPQGSTTFTLRSMDYPSWNINWFDIILESAPPPPPPPPAQYTTVPGFVEAANYSAMSGVQTEPCSEGGENVGYIDIGDWMEYKVYSSLSTTYTIRARIATPNNGAKFNMTITNEATGQSSSAPFIVNNTGGYQTWTNTHSNTWGLGQGNHIVRITSTGAPFNIKNLHFDNAMSPRAVPDVDVVQNATVQTELSLYPNPVQSQLTISSSIEAKRQTVIEIVDVRGMLVQSLNWSKPSGRAQRTIPTTGLKAGTYLLRVRSGSEVQTVRFVKL